MAVALRTLRLARTRLPQPRGTPQRRAKIASSLGRTSANRRRGHPRQRLQSRNPRLMRPWPDSSGTNRSEAEMASPSSLSITRQKACRRQPEGQARGAWQRHGLIFWITSPIAELLLPFPWSRPSSPRGPPTLARSLPRPPPAPETHTPADAAPVPPPAPRAPH
jgi:hypothetical protein